MRDIRAAGSGSGVALVKRLTLKRERILAFYWPLVRLAKGRMAWEGWHIVELEWLLLEAKASGFLA